MAIDFTKIATLANGVTVLNCTPHQITFRHENGEEEMVKPCGATLKATPIEEQAEFISPVSFVKTKFIASPEGEAELDEIQRTIRENLIIVGSIISAQAWPGLVCAMTPAPGYERAAPAEKRMNPNKFTIY